MTRTSKYKKQKGPKSIDAVVGEVLGQAVYDHLERSAPEGFIYEFIGELNSFIDVLGAASERISGKGGSPGDKFLTAMLHDIADVFCHAGGGLGYSEEFRAFWGELKELIARYFKEGDDKEFWDEISWNAVRALTDEAVKSRLGKSNKRKRGRKSG